MGIPFWVGLLAVLIFCIGEPVRDRSQLMQATSSGLWNENAIEASVTIHRSVEEVFRFYRDFENLPGFLGDVMAIQQIDSATSRWTIQGPWAFKRTGR